jgi:hypothetical protein
VAGSVLTTATDVALFMLPMLNARGGSTDTAGTLQRLMLDPVAQVNHRLSWSLGWGIEHDGKRSRFWHWGNNDVFRSFVIGDSRYRRGLVLLTNSSNGHKLYQFLVPKLTGHDHPSLLWFRT